MEAQYRDVMCRHCGKMSGHYEYCDIRQNQEEEAKRAAEGEFTETDRIVAHALGVRLNG